MSQTYVQPPEVRVRRLDEPPFEVTCLQPDKWDFLDLELGQEAEYTAYEYPGPKFWQRRMVKVTRKAKVHHVDCLELQGKSYDAEGTLTDAHSSFYKNDRGFMRAYGYIREEGDRIWVSTWKDNSLNEDWNYDPGRPVRIADVGRWRWLDDEHFTDGDPADTPHDVHPHGAGLWEVQIGQAVHRCLRVLEPDDSAEGIMAEAFVNADGRSVLSRRYNGLRWREDIYLGEAEGKPKDWAEKLPGAPCLYYNDICFVLWDFSIPDMALNENESTLPNLQPSVTPRA